MAHRSVEILLPPSCEAAAREVLAEQPLQLLIFEADDQRVRAQALVPTSGVEPLLDRLISRFPGAGDLRVLVQRVEASIPAGTEGEELAEPGAKPSWIAPSPRVSREELLGVISRGSRVTDGFLLMVALSTVVALIGLVRSNPGIVIGAMVIAPLLGPNMALSLSLTLGDGLLFARAMRANLFGIWVALVMALCIGPFLDLFPLNAELAGRTSIGWGDIGLALASGAAGALALTTGEGMSLVGVMVAVALLPPLVTFGLCLSHGAMGPAVGAAMLLLTNVICVNLAGVATFLIRGFRPRSWWAAHHSARRSRRALTLYVVVLCVIGAYILAVQQGWVPDPSRG